MSEHQLEFERRLLQLSQQKDPRQFQKMLEAGLEPVTKRLAPWVEQGDPVAQYNLALSCLAFAAMSAKALPCEKQVWTLLEESIRQKFPPAYALMLSKNPRFFSGDALNCDDEPKPTVCEEKARLQRAAFSAGVTGFGGVIALEDSKKSPFPPWVERAYVYGRLDLELSAPASSPYFNVGGTKQERREREAELKAAEEDEKRRIKDLTAQLSASRLAQLNQELAQRKADAQQTIRTWKSRYPALYGGDHGWYALQ